jgi:regulator of protease activity HflC (stomatin/prohibitin superfamily)
MNKRSLLSLTGILLAILMLTVTVGCSKIDPGYVGVKVNKWGSDKGVEETPLGTGVYWVGFTWSIYEYPTFQRNELWSKDPHEGKKHDQSITFQSREGMALNADVGCVYQIDQSQAPRLFLRFRQGIEEISDGYLRQLVRDIMNREASKHSIDALYGDGRPAFIEAVQKSVTAEVAPLGINVHNVTISVLRLPPAVLAALDAKVAATQKAIQAENELRQTRAEAQKDVAKAEGEAQALLVSAKARAASNKLIAESLTPLLIERNRIEKWDGKLPQVSGGATPFVNLSTK